MLWNKKYNICFQNVVERKYEVAENGKWKVKFLKLELYST